MRSETIRTAGGAETIRLAADYQGEHTIFVAAEVTDREGTLCPWAENEIYFSAENADIIGVDNGSQFSTERFKSDHRKAFFGKAMVILRVKDPQKPVQVKALAPAAAAPKSILMPATSDSVCTNSPPTSFILQDIYSNISVCGVIGYPLKNLQPARKADSANASLPFINTFAICLLPLLYNTSNT